MDVPIVNFFLFGWVDVADWRFYFNFRQVARKLFVLDYISENIEQFATRMFLSALDQRVSDADLSQSGVTEQRIEQEVRSLAVYSFHFVHSLT